MRTTVCVQQRGAAGAAGSRAQPPRPLRSCGRPAAQRTSSRMLSASVRCQAEAREEQVTGQEEAMGRVRQVCNCGECDGEARIIGGMGAVPGFGWWPIKAYRPCPNFTKSGQTYKRKGQNLDKIMFGREGEETEF
uniref:Uncharacterized protein n=1 Tax=Chloropicon laureae TaxID=464258 RepID=A0A7S2Z0Q0_9CHLO|mmetsp:Transcript_13144/g.33980  ORF Transcript_13144/g.33980 Transcript_13144/m.33980 type:complete len:135 (+) Transcript_13144:85-489(+)|eukprot:CAMPEP_0197488428 /NCGR_PEP_ID=MMETSP1311-20131121/3380_1 /TAXON_ID=464262 /ORGANISM="Genus nov. species nov., Strain RCC856" /LENGTH=134 /DNA_ID=CAMNT_0043032459 /DNA_START=63 /DNA_END=467 /DNA_ORIENTATION=-